MATSMMLTYDLTFIKLIGTEFNCFVIVKQNFLNLKRLVIKNKVPYIMTATYNDYHLARSIVSELTFMMII